MRNSRRSRNESIEECPQSIVSGFGADLDGYFELAGEVFATPALSAKISPEHGMKRLVCISVRRDPEVVLPFFMLPRSFFRKSMLEVLLNEVTGHGYQPHATNFKTHAAQDPFRYVDKVYLLLFVEDLEDIIGVRG